MFKSDTDKERVPAMPHSNLLIFGCFNRCCCTGNCNRVDSMNETISLGNGLMFKFWEPVCERNFVIKIREKWTIIQYNPSINCFLRHSLLRRTIVSKDMLWLVKLF